MQNEKKENQQIICSIHIGQQSYHGLICLLEIARKNGNRNEAILALNFMTQIDMAIEENKKNATPEKTIEAEKQVIKEKKPKK